MKGREIVKQIMENEGVTNAVLSKRLGLTQATLWDRLNTKKAKDIPLSTLIEMLDKLDYKVQIVPGDTEIPEGGYEVEQVE